ncbi:sporulation histidine kinase inhibitor Sda [Paenibacillus lactis]|uniref:sporulation histidine kinase inhibitor Sda n=1 Tax=Paenibacillus TaxID=44249 RepID=UPI0021B3B231|nr:sporulation histidine kinase inhibitor Sda [Paenibacillus sp. IHBB 10380]
MQDNHEMFQEVSNELLLEMYWSALDLGLDQGFIEILTTELAYRGIHVISGSE